MSPEKNPQPVPKGLQTLETLHQRAGGLAPKWVPIVSTVKPSTRPGWVVVRVSLEPGRAVNFEMPEARYSPENVAAILSAAPSLYAPAGLTSNLWAQE